MVLVTGASGLIGQALTRQLLLEGNQVRILLRDLFSPGFEGLQVEKVQGSITDLTSLIAAFTGIETVFHTAGLPSNIPGQYKELYASNVVGTSNVIKACKACNVRRIVFIANYQALSLPKKPGELLREDLGFRPDGALGSYGKTMAMACRLVKEADAAGLPSVILLPSYQIGPFDYKLSILGRFMWDFARGRVGILVHGGFEIVDTRDVAAAALAASATAETGYACIISSGFITVNEFIHWLEALSGRDRPSGSLPSWCLYPVGLFMELQYRLRGEIPILNRSSLKLLSAMLRADTTKARTLLNFTPRPWEQSFADSWNWLAEHYHLVNARSKPDSLLTDRLPK